MKPIKLIDFLTMLIESIENDAKRPQCEEIRGDLQAGANALIVLRQLLRASFPETVLTEFTDESPRR